MSAVDRGCFTTADAGVAAETLSRLIGRTQVQAPANVSFEFSLAWAAAGTVMSRRARVGPDSTVRMGVESAQTINIAQMSAGSMTVRAGGEHHHLGSAPHLMPHDRFTSTMVATDLTVVALEHAWVQDHAHELLQQEDFQLKFTGPSSSSPTAADHWMAAVCHLQEVLNTPEAAAVPLIRTEAQNRVVSALLSCFPSTFDDHSWLGASTPRLPGPVRRAVAYIDEHLAAPLSLAQLAAAARVPGHQLVSAFRQHLGTTPGGYLRTARLDAAHRDLLVADPTRGDSVGAIAYRCGFANLARFTAEYRIRYGRAPTETLHS